MMKGRRASGARNGHYTKPDRTPRGEGVGRGVLTTEIVREILEYQKVGLGHYRIGRLLGLSACTIKDVLRRRTWKHVSLDYGNSMESTG